MSMSLNSPCTKVVFMSNYQTFISIYVTRLVKPELTNVTQRKIISQCSLLHLSPCCMSHNGREYLCSLLLSSFCSLQHSSIVAIHMAVKPVKFLLECLCSNLLLVSLPLTRLLASNMYSTDHCILIYLLKHESSTYYQIIYLLNLKVLFYNNL